MKTISISKWVMVAAMTMFSALTTFATVSAVNLSIGTMPPGKSIRIVYQATVTNPFPAGVCSISSQGTVTGGFGSVVTDDPTTGFPNDATATAIFTVPAMVCPADIITNNISGQCTQIVAFASTVTAGCPAPVIIYNIAGVPITSPYGFPIGTSVVTATATNAAGTNTCSFNVTVTDNDTLTINPTPTNACAGTPNQASGPGSMTAYAWTISNGTINSATNLQTITYTAGASGNVTLSLIVTRPGGCTLSNSVDVPINPVPSTPAIAVVSTNLCANSTGNQAAAPAGATTYAWSITNGVFTSATNTQTVTYTAGASGALSLTVIVGNASGCTANATTNFTINALPSVPTISLSATNVCANTGGFTASGPGGAAGYAWTIGNGSITSATNLQTITYTSGSTGFVTLNLVVANVSGCSASASTNVTITPAPTTATVGSDQTIPPGGTTTGLGGNTPAIGSGFWSIAGGGTGTFNPNGTTPNATFTHTSGAGPVIARWTITNSPCSASFADVTITVGQPPTITPPSDIVTNSPADQCTQNVAFSFSTSGIPAPTVTVQLGTNIITSPYDFSVGTNVVTITASNSVATVSSNFTVTVLETTPPLVVLVGANVLTNECHVPFVDPGATASDTCGGSLTVITNNTVDSDTPGIYTNTYIAVGPTGNSTTNTRTVVVVDTTAPVITINGANPYTNECHVAYVDAGATAQDACAGPRPVSTNNTVNANNPGVYTVKYTSTDLYGNTSTNTRTVVVLDTIGPVITINGANPYTNECHVPYVDAGASALDGCAGSTAVVTNNAVDANDPGTYSVTYTSTDSTGNSTTNVRTVVVVDTTLPVLTVLGANPLTNECHAPFVDPGATASDTCAGSLAVVTNSVVDPNSPGSYTIIYTATDPSGNSVTNTRTVVVIDRTAPQLAIVGANPLTNECHAPFVDPGAVATDTCAGSLSVTTNSTVDPDTAGVYSITYTTTDPSGNSTTNTRTVVVVDTTAPVITINGANPYTNECHVAYVDAGATAQDACAGPRPVSTNNTVNANNPGVYTVKYTSTDLYGNTSTNTRTVVVLDTIGPVITINGANPYTNECHVPYVDAGASALDGCAGSTAVVTNNAVDANDPGTYTVTYTSTDSTGNSTTNVRTVVVVDTTPPLISCPSDRLVIVPSGTASTNVTFTVTASDTCDSSVGVVSTPASGSAFLPGTTLVKSVATDASGNTNTCSFTIHVHPAPVVTIVAPTNNSTFIVGQKITILADASSADGSIDHVNFYRGTVHTTNLLGTATNGYTVEWTGAPPGTNQLLAVATDNLGITWTSSVVNVKILLHHPTSSISLVETNTTRVKQTGLLFQEVTVTNITPLPFAAVRLSISNLPPVVRVWNATGTNNGLPYLLYNGTVPSGEGVKFTIEYFVKDGHTVPNPVFIVDVVAVTNTPPPVGTILSVTRSILLGDGSFLVEFRTLTNRTYYVQYSPDLSTWKTALPSLRGNGSVVQWIDNGPPKTESAPSSVPSRNYRILLLP